MNSTPPEPTASSATTSVVHDDATNATPRTGTSSTASGRYVELELNTHTNPKATASPATPPTRARPS